MKRKNNSHLLFFVVLIIVGISNRAICQTSASLSGSVQDSQGNRVSKARVQLSDPTRNIQLETQTSDEGSFTFIPIKPGTYTVTVEATGFKKYVTTGIVVNVADRQSTGTITMELGVVGDSVEVSADAAQLQIKTESGEQSNLISNAQLQNLAINGRNYLDLMKLTPGVVTTANFAVSGPGGFGNISIAGSRMNQHNLTIDGTTNVDTGSNGTQHIALSLDNIAEFKVLTSNYQAEYGRSAGGDIKILTKSGTRAFHGTGFYFHRHEQFNANSFLNNANGKDAFGNDKNPRNFYRYNQQGYNIGGPVLLPKRVLKDKLFFFFSQEWQEQLVPQNARQSRVPTSLEVSGDFSQTTDGNGKPIIIRDPITGLPFPGNKIPAGRINPSGQAILKLFQPFGNTALGGGNNRFNHNSQSSISYPRRETSIRVDYNISEKTSAYVRYTRDADNQVMPYGLGWTGGNNQIPFDNLIFKQGPAFNSVLNVVTTLSPTLTNEFIFGSSQNNLTLNPTNAEAATYKGIGLSFATPFPYPPNQFFNIIFGGESGIPEQNFAGTDGYTQFPYKNSNTTFDLYDNVSKIFGAHTIKAGFYYQRSRKDQAAGTSAFINFANNTNNPDNAQHPYANALLGNFNSYSQPNVGVFQGQYRSTNVEWYLQDNWKVNRRLTLDYGLRFNLIYPQYDARQQDYYFDPEKYDPKKAVRLYRSDPTGKKNAVDPANPTVPLPNYLVGRIVPGSGDPFNGMVGSKDGYFPGGIKNRGVQYGPAIGFAFDVFGNKKTVLRGGYRIGYDRVSGNALIFPAVGSPPQFLNPTFNFGNLQTVGQNTGGIAYGTFNVLGADKEGYLPNVQSFSVQVQQDIGQDTVLNVGYVGTLGRHLQELVNLNYIPYGTLFNREAQDPSKYSGIVPVADASRAQVYKDAGVNFDGSNALAADFLRRYPGYNTINYRTFGGSSNYHSLQLSLNRRFSKAVSFGAAYTWSKAMGTANADGDFINPVCSRCADYRRLGFDRTHILAVNYDWKIPGIKGGHGILRNIVNGWQVTGISQFISGQPEDITFGIQGGDSGINFNQRIGGSWTEQVRGYVVGDLQSSLSREQYFNYLNLRLPTVAEALRAQGAFPRAIVDRPGINVTDLSIFKNFPLGGDSVRSIQLRLEMFNVFNHAQFNDMNRGVTFNMADQKLTDYYSKMGGSASYIRNVRGGTLSGTPVFGSGVGEVNSPHPSVADRRVIQLAVKIFF